MNIIWILILTLNFFSISCISTSESRNCEPESTQFGSAEFQVQISRYGGQSSQKSLIIVPPTGRTNYIDKSYAEEFCSAGYDVYILDSWTGDVETTIELEIHQRFYGKAQTAITLVLDQIKSSYTGLLGTSVGGLHASIAASYQDRLQAVFVITTGIPIAEVVVNSDQEAMVKLKKERQKRYGFSTTQENILALGKAFTWEPQQLSEKYKEKDLGMSIALNDGTVPTENQIKLQDYWKPKKVITFSSNHFWGIIKTWLFSRDEVLEFFEESVKSRLQQS